MIPGEIRVNAALGDIELNAGRETKPYRWLIMAIDLYKSALITTFMK